YGGIETITLAVDEGILTATAGDSGVFILSGDGTGTLVLSGTIAQLNAFLGSGGSSTLVYFNGSDNPSPSTTLSLAINDGGNTGAGGALTDIATATINIISVNDIPVVAATDVTGGVTELVTPVGDLTDTGTIAFTDVDLTDSHTISSITSSPWNPLGELTASVTSDTTGTGLGGVITWSYSVAASAVEYLGAKDNKVESFTITLDDGNGGTVDRTIEITITGTNDAPVITTAPGGNEGAMAEAGNLDDGTVIAGTPSATGTLSSSDVDTGATAEWTGNQTTAYGLFSIDPLTGVWTYTLDQTTGGATDSLAEGAVVTETFTATVTDDFGATATQDVTVTITGTNDSPIALDETLTPAPEGWSYNPSNGHYYQVVDEGVTFGQAVAGAEALGGYLATITTASEQAFIEQNGLISQSTDATWIGGQTNNPGAAQAANWTWVTGPEAGQQISYSNWNAGEPNGGFGVSAQYAQILRGLGTWNDAPDSGLPGNGLADGYLVEWGGNPGDAGYSEDSVLTVDTADLLANDSDVDTGAVLTVTGVSATSANGAPVTLAGTDITYDPNVVFNYLAAGETVTDSFTYTVTDDKGATDTATVTLTVVGTNDGPIAVADDNAADALVEQGFGVAGDNTAQGNVLTNDSDVDASDVLSVVSLSDGVTTVTPAAPGDSLSLTGVYGTLQIAANGVWTYLLDNGDADTEALADGDTGIESFTYTVSDGNGGTDTATLTLEIAGSGDNVPPVANDDNIDLFEDTAATLDLLGNDTDANNVPVVTQTLSIVSINGQVATVGATIATTNGSITIGAGGSVDYTPNANFNGIDDFTYVISDGLENSNEATVTLDLAAVNDAPVVSGPVMLDAIAEDSGARIITQAELLATASDVDGPSLTAVDLVVSSGAGTLTDNGDGTWSYVPAANDNAEVNFGYHVTDGIAAPVAVTAVMDIAPVNDAPIAQPLRLDVEVGGSVDGTLFGDDVDADDDSGSLTYALVSSPSSGEVSGDLVSTNGSDFTYLAPRRGGGYHVNFQYAIGDSHGARSSTELVTIYIRASRPAYANKDEFSIDEDTQLTGNVLVNNGYGADFDVDGDAITVSAGTFLTSMGGSVTIQSNGNFVYDPFTDFSGEDSFSYSISDVDGSSTADVVINVIPANDTPGPDRGGEGEAEGAEELSAKGSKKAPAEKSEKVQTEIGSETLYGGDGDQILTGGSGSDTFVFKSGDTGHDTVTDFSAGEGLEDVLQFETAIFADADAVLAAATDDGTNTIITIDADTSVTLENVSVMDLNKDDFQFV
ncbi:MAG: Ig-like domain-containing protein, partial [Roseibium sp.]